MSKIHLILGLFTCLMLITSCGDGDGDLRKAVTEGNFEGAHEILDKMYNEFLETYESNVDGFFGPNRSKIESEATKYAQAASYVLCAEARYLISEDNDKTVERIAYLFNEVRVMGEPAKSYHPEGVAKLQVECIKYTCYNQTSIYNNQLCDVVLNLAILHDNQQLAKIALSYYRPNGIIIENIFEHGEGDVEWRYVDKEAAQRRYDEHFEAKDNLSSYEEQSTEVDNNTAEDIEQNVASIIEDIEQNVASSIKQNKSKQKQKKKRKNKNR